MNRAATIRSLAMIAALTSLGGCSLLFPEDPREGVEPAEECPVRVAEILRLEPAYAEYAGEMGVPTYTYDITKMAFEDMQRLMIPGSDDTAGARAMAATNEISTAVDNFMQITVDEKGAFFTGNDPSLFRVRGSLQPVSTMIASGCARQQEGMRLIMIDIGEVPADRVPETEPETDAETDADLATGSATDNESN